MIFTKYANILKIHPSFHVMLEIYRNPKDICMCLSST